MLKTWSYSRLVTFEQCPLRAKLQYVDRIPEPERHLPPGKTEHANDRGTRVHEAAELYVKGGVELVPELQCFQEEFLQLRDLYKEGRVSLEGEWGHARDWTPVAWMSDNVWLRLKLDAMVHVGEDHAVVIDYKTGKRQGNEIKPTEQGQLYAAATQARYPELKNITVEFWYTDLNEIVPAEYDHDDIVKLRARFDARGTRLTDEDAFPAKPSIFNCKYCPYGSWGTGHCEKGVGGRADLWKLPSQQQRVGAPSAISHPGRNR
jgi:CRISPR/Cas system-associated exonuclease Cas4 (RecB family)